MVLFWVCIALIILFSYIAEKKESRVALFFAILVLVLLTGLRAESVGIDTSNYYRQFRLVEHQSVGVAFKEVAYIQICRFLISIFHEYWIMILLFSAIIGVLVMLRCWEFREKLSFTLAVVFFLIVHLTSSMNIMRQYISVAIVFYATRYLEKEKYIRFFIGLLIAICFHFTSIIGAAFLPFYLLTQNRIRGRIWKVPLVLIALAAGGVVVFISRIDAYSFYTSNYIFQGIGAGLILKLLTVVIFFFAYVYSMERGDNRDMLKLFCLLEVCQILLSSLGYFFIYLSRISLVFDIFEPLLFSYMFLCSPKRQVVIGKRIRINFYNVTLFVYGAYVAYISVARNGNGVFPYKTIFGF